MEHLAEQLDESESSKSDDHHHTDDGKQLTDNDALTEMTENKCMCTKKEKKFKKLSLSE